MAKLAIVGLGMWGPNLLRTFNSLGVVAAAFDLDAKILKKFAKDPSYTGVYFDTDWEKCLGRNDIDGVVIATPPNTHYNIAMKALKAGKHLFIEKPMTLDVKESKEIFELSSDLNRVVLVGHIFLYSPEIIKLKELISKKQFGEVQYIYTQRLNLGKIQNPANVVEDLAPHDISILDYLLDEKCTEVQVMAKSHVIDTEDVAFVNMKYGDTLCNLHLSWLDPFKIRNTVVVGTKQMAVCDSMDKTITLYNKSVNVEKLEGKMSESYSNYIMNYTYGDVVMPHIESKEPMMVECREFLDCIEKGTTPLASSELGYDVVKVLDAMQKSLKGDGKWVKL
jgi:predicted dehydrogenase